MAHRAGFVNIIGNPNVGKSTLMNALVGEKLSIVTAKAQTTRHRIMGIVSGEDFQIVYSDTPGILKPNYRLQENMLSFVDTAIVRAVKLTDGATNHDGTLGSEAPHSMADPAEGVRARRYQFRELGSVCFVCDNHIIRD